MYFIVSTIMLCLFCSMASGNEIIRIADPRIKAVLIQESNEVLVDLANPDINPPSSKIKLMPNEENANAGFYHAPHSDCFKVRTGLHQALKTLVSKLPGDIGIYVYEAYRPLSVQKQYFDKVSNKIK